MAQGMKKIQKSAASKRSTTLGPKKGHRVIAPKKATLVKQKTLQKKLSAGLIGKTERNLAEKAGHLELLAGGKREKKKAEADKQKRGGEGKKAMNGRTAVST